GLGQIAPVVALDQVGDDLGVGLRGEGVTVVLERGLELAVVLDDSVEDDRQLGVLATGQRVGVLLTDPPVCCPAGMAEAGRRERAVRASRILQELEVSDGSHVLEAVVLPQHQTGGVVAPVLEPLETVEEKILTGPVPDGSADPAHPTLLGRSLQLSLQIRPRNANEPGYRPLPASEAASRALVSRELRSYHTERPLPAHFRPPRARARPARFRRAGRARDPARRAR